MPDEEQDPRGAEWQAAPAGWSGRPPVEGKPQCRVCGCRDDNACVLPGPAYVCGWVESVPGGGAESFEDLCTACLPGARSGWVHPSAKAIETELEVAMLLDPP